MIEAEQSLQRVFPARSERASMRVSRAKEIERLGSSAS
jgi:hypothetical protein